MVAAPEYPLKTQAKFPPAMAAIHNFIRLHDPDSVDRDAEIEVERQPPHHQPGDLGTGSISRRERERATAKRDNIAKAMWAQYVAYLDAREGGN